MGIRKIYGIRSNNGSSPSHWLRGAGGLARKALQSLEALKVVEKDQNGGRRLTSQGRRDLDRIAAQIKAKTLKLLINFFLCKRHPLIDSQSSIIPGIVILEQSFVVTLSWDSQTMLLWDFKELFHHGRKLSQLDDSVLIRIMISEHLQHIPVELNSLGRRRRLHGSFDEGLELVDRSLVNDGVRIHGCHLGRNVLLAKFEPFIEGDNTS